MSEPAVLPTVSRMQVDVVAPPSSDPMPIKKPPFSRLVFAMPTYGHVDPKVSKCARSVIMHSAYNGVTWVADASPDRMGWVGARNSVAKAALETDADGIFWMDSDMIVPPSTVTRLVSYGRDFTSAVYFQRVAPHWPLITHYNEQIGKFQFAVKWPANVLFPADGVGFGCCFTSTHMLRRMRDELPEVGDDNWFASGEFSEDFSFCLRARKLGYPVYVDTGLMVGHMGEPEVVTVDQFKAVNPYQAGTAEPIELPSVEGVAI